MGHPLVVSSLFHIFTEVIKAVVMDTQVKDKLFTRSYILVCVANFLTSFSFFLLVPTLPFYLAKGKMI